MTVTSGISAEAMWGNAPRGGNAGVMERSQQFFDKTDRGRNGATATPLEGAR
jgi:hypothetical protein